MESLLALSELKFESSDCQICPHISRHSASSSRALVSLNYTLSQARLGDASGQKARHGVGFFLIGPVFWHYFGPRCRHVLLFG